MCEFLFKVLLLVYFRYAPHCRADRASSPAVHPLATADELAPYEYGLGGIL